MSLLFFVALALGGKCGTSEDIRDNYKRTHKEPHDNRVFGDEREAWRVLRMASEGSWFLAGNSWAFEWLELKYDTLSNEQTPHAMIANVRTWRERHTWRYEIANILPPQQWIDEAQARLGCEGSIPRSATTTVISPKVKEGLRTWSVDMSDPNLVAVRAHLYEFCSNGDSLSCQEAILLTESTDSRISSAATMACDKDRYRCAPIARHLRTHDIHPTVARELAKRGCDRGLAEACTLSGDLLVLSEPQKAFFEYDKACQQLEPAGCVGKARLMTRNFHGENRVLEASEKHQAMYQACDLHPAGCTLMADEMLMGNIGSRDIKIARKVAAKGCAERSPAGCTRVAELYVKLDAISLAVPKERAMKYQDLDRGLLWARRGCELGAPSSCELASVIESIQDD